MISCGRIEVSRSDSQHEPDLALKKFSGMFSELADAGSYCMNGLMKLILLLAIMVLCLLEFVLHRQSGIFREFEIALLSLQWILLVCLATWISAFFFLKCCLSDLPLIGLLLFTIAVYFIGHTTFRWELDAVTLLAGVTLGKGARFALRQNEEGRMQKIAEIGNQKSEIRMFLIGLVLLLAFSSWWRLDLAGGFYHGPRWMGLWNNPNDYGLLMAVGLILAVGLLAAKRRKRHRENSDFATKERREHKDDFDSSPRPFPRGARRGSDFLRFLRFFTPTYICRRRGDESHFENRKSVRDSLRRLLPVLLFIAAGMMTVGLLFSYSRGAWIGTAIGLLYLAKACGKCKWRWVLPPVLVVVAVVVLFWHTPRTAPWYFQRLDMSRGSVQHRLVAWKAGFEIMRDHPFGVGWNKTVETYQKNYSPPEDGAAAITTNDYLMLGTQLGWPGLICFVTYAGLCLGVGRWKMGDRTKFGIRNSEFGIKLTCRSAALAMLVAFWFDGGLFKLATASVFWILLELGVERRQKMEDRRWKIGEEKAESGRQKAETVQNSETGSQKSVVNSQWSVVGFWNRPLRSLRSFAAIKSEIGNLPRRCATAGRKPEIDSSLVTSVAAKTVAFTLVELLTVIAIIALLAAILLPVLSASKKRAAQATCINNERQLGLGMQMYVQDHNNTFPGIASRIYGFHSQDWIYWRTNTDLYPPFQKSPILTYIPGPQKHSVLRCPLDDSDVDRLGLVYIDRLALVSRDDSGPYFFSYSFNGYGLDANKRNCGMSSVFDNKGKAYLFKENEVRRPSTKIMLAEEPASLNPHDNPAVTESGDFVARRDIINDGRWVPGITTGLSSDVLTVRHGGKADVTFGDGHVEAVTPRFGADTNNTLPSI